METANDLFAQLWRPINLACAVLTFLFGIFLVCWGPQATISRDIGARERIEHANQLETLRSECRELSARMDFARNASDNFSGFAIVFLCLVFAVLGFNVHMIRRGEVKSQRPNSGGGPSMGIPPVEGA